LLIHFGESPANGAHPRIKPKQTNVEINKRASVPKTNERKLLVLPEFHKGSCIRGIGFLKLVVQAREDRPNGSD
jgi:hypothetical protein